MSMNATPRGERVHISFFGQRNAGKSSLINAVTSQDLAVVSAVPGTTTDPVYKAMELLPLGPVVVIDTPGLDDSGELGNQRVQKTLQVINKTDLAILVVDGLQGLSPADKELEQLLKKKNIPFVTVFTKSDLKLTGLSSQNAGEIWVSTKTGQNISQLKELLAHMQPTEKLRRPLVGDLIAPNDFVLLVVPIDKAAPKGRLILPQQQTIRAILEAGATAVVVREQELKNTLAGLGKQPGLVITDSQVFAEVAAATPADIPLTSFSILFARYKGDLARAVTGAQFLKQIKSGENILIAEGCTHHRQCGDIGTVKLPGWIEEFTGQKIRYTFTSGTEYPENLADFKLIVHCGGCMLNAREMKYRLAQAEEQNILITNYGILIAHMQGILPRSVAMFPDIRSQLED